MKSLPAFLILSALLSFPCLAQRTTPVGVGGFGNVLHPGTGSPAAFRGTGFTSAPARGTRRTGGYSAGYAAGYPLYVGGSYIPAYSSGTYGSGYAPDYSSQTQLNPQQQYAGAPPVVINQYFGPPVPPEPVTGLYQPYAQRQQQEDDASEPAPSKYYLLAFKDHSVYSALAYWVEDKTLHYVTPQNTHNQASLDLVDVEFTTKLNQDRAVPFSVETPSAPTRQ
jgi:hypothetical protein